MEQLKRLTVKQLIPLVRWYNIEGRSKMTLKAELIEALSNIPEIIDNVQEIINNIVEIVAELRNNPKRPIDQPNLRLPIPHNTPIPIENTKKPTPPGLPDRFNPDSPPQGRPPPRISTPPGRPPSNC